MRTFYQDAAMPTSLSSPAFLSVRLPPATRDRLKAVAAARGESVQGLVGSLVEQFLAEQGRAPDLATILRVLRAHAEPLQQRGLATLWVFGSVARGEARADSDVDLMAAFDPATTLSLVGLASLRAELSDLLQAPADLVERSALRPAVREAADREAVRVW
ncbi:MAG TPA: nucleotidyltransferase family protein [Frateuria sp.]|uniref:nucleotidyltransferase family protein n=1 Tax=Frateuria sp. TaxID=2211372 RepID=UPI002D7FB1B8|nr:nucleotidyltransferase family protein [Frateuria sp.]HET6804186.1 nucleotidyltransferase family protein [Frateuria sp.]